jgi:hypothetical protein
MPSSRGIGGRRSTRCKSKQIQTLLHIYFVSIDLQSYKHNRTETMTKSVAQVKIGEKLVPAIGFGAMGFSVSVYGEALNYEDRFKVSRHGCI